MGQRTVFAFVATLCGAAAAGLPASAELLVGTWSSGAPRQLDYVLRVTPTELTYGSCTSPYSVLLYKERAAHRSSSFPHHGTWTYIALQLRPDRSSYACRDQPEVLEFAIPNQLLCHAELATYPSLETYWRSAYNTLNRYMSNEDCTKRQAPKTSLEHSSEP
jgi:hypothetical protein